MHEKKWRFNSLTRAEVVIILDLVKNIYSKTKTISERSITICNNNWKLHQRIVAIFVKELQDADEGGVEISQIR